MKTFADLTDDELRKLYIVVFPFTRDRKIDVIRPKLKTDDPCIEIVAQRRGVLLTVYESGEITVENEWNYNPFDFVKACAELGVTYQAR